MNETQFDSSEELYFSYWIEELVKAGFILRWEYHPKPFFLSEPVWGKYIEQLKTKVKERQYELLSAHSYQADFKIVWDISAKYIFFNHINPSNTTGNIKLPFVANNKYPSCTDFSVVDVKGNYNANDAWRRFSIEQKWVYQRYKIYVQKIIVAPTSKGKPKSALFSSTFTPLQYFLTDKKKEPRKINFKTRSLKEYIEQMKLSR